MTIDIDNRQLAVGCIQLFYSAITELKRLVFQTVVCNVELIATLRSRGAIQPGVHRCKLIAPRERNIPSSE